MQRRSALPKTFFYRRLIGGVLLVLLGLLTVTTLGPPASFADGRGVGGASTSSVPASSVPATADPSGGTQPRTGGGIEYNATLHCEDEGCVGVSIPLPSGVAAGGRAVPQPCSAIRNPAGGHAPRRGVICESATLPGSSR